ncbi:MAG: hypothetical protein AB8G99_05170 [Planctomycetaceae bacterium]
MNRPGLPLHYRPHPVGVFLWLIVAPAIGIGLFCGFRWLEMPFLAQVFAGFLAAGVLLTSLHVLTSYFKITENGIVAGYFFGASGSWGGIDAWTRWGKSGSLFIRFKNGRIVGTGGWAFYGDRVDVLESTLRTYVGEPTHGDDGVIPRILDLFVGGLMRNAG